MSWIRDHLHTFVYPNLASMEDATWDKDTETLCRLELEREIKKRKLFWRDGYYFNTRESYQLIFHAIDRLESLLRNNTKSLFLTGRDTWHFYVACMRKRSLRDRTFFFPQINRETSKHPIAVKLLTDGRLKADDILLDTGFIGSIFTQLQVNRLPNCDFYLLCKDNASPYKTLFSRDLFPAFTRILPKNANRNQVLVLEERTPKYWESAFVLMPNRPETAFIVQKLTQKGEFLRCAADTCLIADRSIA